LLFYCRLPSKATLALKGNQKALKISLTSYTELKTSYETNLVIMKDSIAEFKLFVEKAIVIFGGDGCTKVGATVAKKFTGIKVCASDDCKGFSARVLSFSSLSFVIGKPPNSSDEDSAFFGVDLKANGTVNVRRNL